MKILKTPGVRKVYFGIRIRLLGLLILVMVFIVAALTIIMYFNQIRLLNDEKRDKAGTLAQILSGPAEFYMDKNIKTTKPELDVKYRIIAEETANFKKYNGDIVKIFLTDEKGRILYSTQPEEIGTFPKLSYLTNSLEQKAEKLNFYDYRLKSRDKKERKYQAITYPIFLHNGNLVDILKDYNRYYQAFRKADKTAKNNIYIYLWQKYQAALGTDFAPGKTNKNSVRSGDIDFLFLRLFSNIMELRSRHLMAGDAWLWKDSWLTDLKMRKYKAFENDNSDEAKKADDLAAERMNYIYNQVD
jgi:hypothetical protein